MEILPMVITVLVALITAVIGPTILEIVKSKLAKKDQTNSHDAMFKEMEVDLQINEQLSFLLRELNCDRIWVSQFHNGGYYYSSGVSIKKYSIFYELVAPGISRIQQLFQNIPTSFFSKSLIKVYEDDELEISDMNTDIYGLAATASETGCKSTFLYGLKNLKGKLHGVLAVEYVKDHHTFTDEEKNIIRDTGTFISGALSIIHK